MGSRLGFEPGSGSNVEDIETPENLMQVFMDAIMTVQAIQILSDQIAFDDNMKGPIRSLSKIAGLRLLDCYDCLVAVKDHAGPEVAPSNNATRRRAA